MAPFSISPKLKLKRDEEEDEDEKPSPPPPFQLSLSLPFPNPSSTTTTKPYSSGSTDAERLSARRWGDGRKTPKQIVSELRANFPGNVTSQKQVANFLQKLQYEDRGELTVTQWSLRFLVEHKYVVYPLRDVKTDEVAILFFANPESLWLMKKFPYVVIIDATYKTNKYGMPLVEIVGFTNTHQTFNIAYAFTRAERIYHYTWIMRKIRALCLDLGVMPTAIMTDCEQTLITAIDNVFGNEVQHLLCWVHIRHNIEAHASSILKTKESVDFFTNQCWGLFCSTSEEIYEERLAALRTSWKSGLVGYVEDTWLTPYKKSIVRAWTDHHLHFFTRTSTRVEGMYKILKDIIGSSRGGFNRVIVRIHHAIILQIDHIRASMNMSLTKRPTDFDDPAMLPAVRAIFSRLFYQVSDRCFDLLLASYERLLKEQYEEECTDHWVRNCLGMPCVHVLANAIIMRTPLIPEDFHPFWRDLEWEDAPTTSVFVDQNVRMNITEMRLREMWARMDSGTLKKGTTFQLGELYHDLEYSEESTLLEPTEIRAKGRLNGSRNKLNKVEKREKCLFEHRQEELKQKEKKAKRKASESSGRGPSPRKEASGPSPVVIGFEELQSQPVPEESQSEDSHWPEEPSIPIVHMGVNFGVDNVDDFWIPYIKHVRDIRPDGHCGYRSMAVLLGREDKEYVNIRRELVVELLDNRDLYEPIRSHLRKGSWDDLILQVNHYRSPCSSVYWLHMPMMGLVFATLYQVGLVFLTWEVPTLCLPLRARTSSVGPPQSILAMAHVGNHDHFIPVVLKDGSPIPHTPILWRRNADPNILWWATQYERNLKLYREYRIANGRAPDPFMYSGDGSVHVID